jgi:fumarate reductase subunit D
VGFVFNFFFSCCRFNVGMFKMNLTLPNLFQLSVIGLSSASENLPLFMLMGSSSTFFLCCGVGFAVTLVSIMFSVGILDGNNTHKSFKGEINFKNRIFFKCRVITAIYSDFHRSKAYLKIQSRSRDF